MKFAPFIALNTLIAVSLSVTGLASAKPAIIGANPIIDCTYNQYSNQFGVTDASLKLKFELDPEGPTGFIIDQNGSVREVKLIYEGNGAAFIDQTSTGEMLVTSIDRQHNSVHSSHRVSLQGKLFAKQYYGTCISTKDW